MEGISKKIGLVLFLLVIFVSFAHAYTIDGDSVFMEDAQASLRVTPHTATSPKNNFSQSFELCNKTAGPSNVYAAYIFNQALESGKVEYWKEPFTGTRAATKTCPGDFNYVLNEDADANPHRAWCFETVYDVNGLGYDANLLFWEQEFASGDPGAKMIAYTYERVHAGYWSDVTAYFTNDYLIHQGRHIYPYTTGLLLPANSCKNWRVSYSPSTTDGSKKWDLWLWSGASWNCILTDTCTKTLKLDPWWNSDWERKKAIQLTDQDYNKGATIRVEFDASALNIQKANLDDVRVVDENTDTELDRLVDGTSSSTDANVYFRLKNSITTGDAARNTTYYLYYDNSTAGAGPWHDDDGAARTRVNDFEGKAKDLYYYPNAGDWDLNTSGEMFGPTQIYAVTETTPYSRSEYFTQMPRHVEYSWWVRPLEGTSAIASSDSGNYVFNMAFQSDGRILYYYTNQAKSQGIWLTGDSYFVQIWAGGTPDYDITVTQMSDNNVVTQDTNVVSWNAIAKDPDVIWNQMNDTGFDNVWGMALAIDHSGLGAEEVSNVSPDVNVVYPNGLETLSTTTDIDFNVSDPDNTVNTLDANIYIDNKDLNTTLTVATDVNLFASGRCDSTNFTASVACSYSYNFGDLNEDTNYMVRVTVTDASKASASDFSDDNFSVVLIQTNLTIFSRANLDDLTEDGANFGEDSEAWEQSEDKTRGLNALNVNTDQLLAVKALNDNTTLTAYVNNNQVGTIDSNASDPQFYQIYVFDVSSAYLTANPQNVRIVANGSQATTYVDYIAFIDIDDSNYVSGGKDVAVLWDVNLNSNPQSRNAAVVQQGAIQTIVDANTISNSKGEFIAIIEDLSATDQNIQGWVQVTSGATLYESDTNKTMEVDATDPVINSVTMTLNVIANRAYGFDSNITEKNFSSSTLTIEGIEYDLNTNFLINNDINSYDDFNFTSSGAYSCVLATFDAVDRNATYSFTVNSSVIDMTQNAEDQNTNWSRTNAIDINSTAQYVDASFRGVIDFTGTGTANITSYDFNYTLYNGTSESLIRGSVFNTELRRNNKSVLDMTDNQLVHTGLIASDLNQNSTAQDVVLYDVNDVIEVQWKNTGAEDQRLIHIDSSDHNTALTDFWVKVELRSPFDPATTKVYFKECVEGINFAAGTCTSYNVHDIYAETDGNFNGGTFPTEDTDDDGLKDTLYFKVPSLSEHMYSIDNTATAEPAWGVSGGSGGGGGGGSSGGTDTGDVNGDAEPGEADSLDTGFLGLLPIGDFLGGAGELFGAGLSWAGLQYSRLIAQGVFTGENLFTIVALAILLIGVFIFVPMAESRAKQKNFGVRV